MTGPNVKKLAQGLSRQEAAFLLVSSDAHEFFITPGMEEATGSLLAQGLVSEERVTQKIPGIPISYFRLTPLGFDVCQQLRTKPHWFSEWARRNHITIAAFCFCGLFLFPWFFVSPSFIQDGGGVLTLSTAGVFMVAMGMANLADHFRNKGEPT